jgi:hypothetical protein
VARGPEQATSVGTFLGPAKHDVAIPFDRLKLSSTSHVLVLAGATKEVLTAMPKFEYAKKDGGLQRDDFPRATGGRTCSRCSARSR